jgi:hypothetical protein
MLFNEMVPFTHADASENLNVLSCNDSLLDVSPHFIHTLQIDVINTRQFALNDCALKQSYDKRCYYTLRLPLELLLPPGPDVWRCICPFCAVHVRVK